MSVLPDSLIKQIEFCESHLPKWAASPGSIGLTSGQVSALAAATTSARASFNAAQAARLASRGATLTMRDDVALMRKRVSDIVRQIKAFAEFQAVPESVYAASLLPVPAQPSPSAAPGKPTDFSIALNFDGSVSLSWSAENAAAGTGAFFTVARKLPGQREFVGIGGTAGSTTEARRVQFTDNTIPASAASRGAKYVVQGFRGTRAGETSEAIVVNFGIDDASAALGGKTSNMKFAA